MKNETPIGNKPREASMKRAREIWESMEHSRGVYHANDREAYITAFAAALDEKPVGRPSEEEILAQAEIEFDGGAFDEARDFFESGFEQGAKWVLTYRDERLAIAVKAIKGLLRAVYRIKPMFAPMGWMPEENFAREALAKIEGREG